MHSSSSSSKLYSKATKRNIHSVGVDIAKACGDIGVPANRSKRIVEISSQVTKVEEAGVVGDFSRLYW